MLNEKVYFINQYSKGYMITKFYTKTEKVTNIRMVSSALAQLWSFTCEKGSINLYLRYYRSDRVVLFGKTVSRFGVEEALHFMNNGNRLTAHRVYLCKVNRKKYIKGAYAFNILLNIGVKKVTISI